MHIDTRIRFLQSINFSTTVVNEALGKEKQLKNFFANVESHLRQHVRAFLSSAGFDCTPKPFRKVPVILRLHVVGCMFLNVLVNGIDLIV